MDALLRLPPPFALPGLLDERSDPDFRRVFGWLCGRSTEVDVALTRIRLSTLDLDAAELARVRRLRLLLAEVNAVSLDAEAHGLLQDPRRGAALRRLADLLDRGVIEIRAAPLAGWSPDFTVFSSDAGPEAALLGYHWFQRPFPHRGPALAALHGAGDARRVRARFEEAWGAAHDIGSAVEGILERSRRAARDRSSPTRSPAGGGAVSEPREPSRRTAGTSRNGAPSAGAGRSSGGLDAPPGLG